MRSSSLCCAPPLPLGLLSLPALPPSMLGAASLPLSSLAGRRVWVLNQSAHTDASPAIFVRGNPVAHARLAGKGIPVGRLRCSASLFLELQLGGVAGAPRGRGAWPGEENINIWAVHRWWVLCAGEGCIS